MSFVFQSQDYGNQFDPFLTEQINELGPGAPDDAIGSRLARLSVGDLFPRDSVVDMNAASCCLSAIWLLHDFLDESHTVSQSIDTSSGSYWHGIMHRREQDYSNAKYWFRRVGDHPIFDTLAESARELAEAAGTPDAFSTTSWDPYAFVDHCQAAAGTGSAAENLCRQVARAEWELLFNYCYRKAVGEN